MQARTSQSQRLRGLDRLPALIAAAVGVLAACGGTGSSEADKGGSSRVVGVQAKTEGFDPKAFCETYVEPDQAKPMAYPELVSAPAAPDRPRWINVWATWCKPCIEELPRMRTWEKTLAEEGVRAELVLLAADELEAVSDYETKHPEAAGSLRMKDATAVETWLGSIGVGAASVLPIHLFVDGQDRLRCIRMGGVGATDYDRVKALLQSLG